MLVFLVATLYPSRTVFAAPCPAKGADAYATKRMASFLRLAGVRNLTYVCDQEAALTAMMTQALQVVKASGEWVGTHPQRSAVGESQSNGRAEVAVQQVEDQTRTLFAELEHNLGIKISADHPVLSWLVEYVAVLIKKYHPHDDTGKTAYKMMYGHEVDERLAMFGEKVFFHVHSKHRAELDLR